MKKIVSLVLAALLVLSLAACGSKDNASDGNPVWPTSALNILETVWNTYGEDEKFAVAGGDFSEANAREDAPGVFDLKDRALADSELGLPETAEVDEAASLVHMMNANTFTAGAFHVASSSDVDSVVSDLKDNIMNRQWMCGFPDKLVILTLGDYVISCYGAEDLVDQFSEKVTEAFTDAAVVCDEAIA